MKIDVTQQIMQLDSSPIVTGKQTCAACGQVVGDEEPMTARMVATRALTSVLRGEQDLPGEEKVTRFQLALRIMNEDEPDLKVEEIVLVKKVVGKMYGPLIVGRMWAILDPDE